MDGDMEEADILEPYEVSFSDLMLLSSCETALSASSRTEQEMLQTIRRNIMENLGPTGPGLFCITGVPNASFLRRKLLPFARKLALLSSEQRKHILKEHSLGTDVPLKNPDRIVSSFARQLKYAQSLEPMQGNKLCDDVDGCLNSGHDDLDADILMESQDDGFKNLSIFKDLGFCMMKLGLSVARICDREIGGQELEQSLLESCMAKGRLIHYHSAIDNLHLKEAERRKQFSKQKRDNKGDQRQSLIEKKPSKDNLDTDGIHFNLWQQWHYDYGIFTVLTDPLFLLSPSSSSTMLKHPFSDPNIKECASSSGHSYLQIYHPSKNKILIVKTPPESFIIQVGESADILSRGKVRSTLHCVRRPQKLENISRETFVVFLQPAWSKTFSISDYTMEHLKLGGRHSEASDLNNLTSETNLDELAQEIQKIVPPLPSRLKDGMTFAEFSRQTTKQYYGGNGLQSNR